MELVNSLMFKTDRFAIIRSMSKKKKKPKAERPVFDSLRKPTAPPSQKFGGEKPEEKIHPAGRKVKHKKTDNDD